MRIRLALHNRRLRQRHKLRQLSSESGSFTLEAALVLPTLLLVTLALIFVSLFIYEKGHVYQEAMINAERAAFIWDNSFKDPVTGRFTYAQQDDLYWRTFQDDFSGLFFLPGSTGSSIELPRDTDIDWNGDLPRQKLGNMAEVLPSSVDSANITYHRSWLQRMITVRLEKQRIRPDFLASWMSAESIVGSGQSHIVDPVEFIRMIDFARHYASRIQGRMTKEEISAVFTEPSKDRAPRTFEGHDQDVVPYLQQLVRGKEVARLTTGGKTRRIDALDRGEIAHQAYCTYSKNNLLNEQMPKDVDLLKSGAVKGVVWHFFTHCRGKQPKPSAAIQKELRRSGIVVVVHD